MAYLLLTKITSKELAGEVFDAVKNNNSFTSIVTINAEIGQVGQASSPLPSAMAARKRHFKYNLSHNMQLIVASSNEKSSEESSSDKDCHQIGRGGYRGAG